MHREQGRLDREDDHQKHCRDTDQSSFVGGNSRDLSGEVSDVERTCAGVKRAQCKEEQGRPRKVHHHILQTRAHPLPTARVDHQTIRGDEQDFEEDEQVEDVAGQERAADTHELELKKRVEMFAAIVPAGGHRVQKHHEGQDRGQKHHQRRQPVEDQNDAEWGRPVPQTVDVGCAVHRHAEKHHRDSEQENGADSRCDTGQNDIVPHHEPDDRGDHGRKNDRKDDPMAHFAALSSVSV